LACLGLLISGLATSNKISLATSLFLLLALFAPTQLPAGTRNGPLGETILRANPIAPGEHYIGAVLLSGHPWTADLDYLISPAVIGALACLVLSLAGDRLPTLIPGAGRR
jgi:ABC-2 type transport system permease protein